MPINISHFTAFAEKTRVEWDENKQEVVSRGTEPKHWWGKLWSHVSRNEWRKSVNRKATQAFIDSLKEEYGERIGHLASKQLSSHVENGKPLTGRRIKKVIAQAEQESKRTGIQELNERQALAYTKESTEIGEVGDFVALEFAKQRLLSRSDHNIWRELEPDQQQRVRETIRQRIANSKGEVTYTRAMKILKEEVGKVIQREENISKDPLLQEMPDSPKAKSQLYDLFHHPSVQKLHEKDPGFPRYYRLLVRSCWKNLLEDQDLNEPLPLADVWRGVLGEDMPEDVTTVNFAEKILDTATKKYRQNMSHEEKKKWRRQGINTVDVLGATLSQGLSFEKALEFAQGTSELRISMDDLVTELRPTAITGYTNENDYGLPVDIHRWVAPTSFRFSMENGTQTIDPNEFKQNEQLTKEQTVQSVIERVRTLCTTTRNNNEQVETTVHENQVRRVCQFLTQMPPNMFRGPVNGIFGLHYDEHGPHTFSIEKENSGNIKVTISSNLLQLDENTPQFDANMVVSIDREGGCTFTSFSVEKVENQN